MESTEAKAQNEDDGALEKKLAGMNERLDDMLSELSSLQDLMPDEDDLENLQKYNRPCKLPPWKESKKQQRSLQSSDHQQPHVDGNKKTE